MAWNYSAQGFRLSVLNIGQNDYLRGPQGCRVELEACMISIAQTLDDDEDHHLLEVYEVDPTNLFILSGLQ